MLNYSSYKTKNVQSFLESQQQKILLTILIFVLNLNSYKCKYIMNNKNSEITFNRYNQSLSSYYIIRSRHDIAEILLKLALSTNQSLKVKKSNDYKKVSQKIIIKYKCYAYLRYASLPLISI